MLNGASYDPPAVPEPTRATARAITLTGLAVTAFAANSLLCRLSLHDGGMDPVGFTVVRMVSAALVLALLDPVIKSRGDGNGVPRQAPSQSIMHFGVRYHYA